MASSNIVFTFNIQTELENRTAVSNVKYCSLIYAAISVFFYVTASCLYMYISVSIFLCNSLAFFLKSVSEFAFGCG